jgi:hypothetical protein
VLVPWVAGDVRALAKCGTGAQKQDGKSFHLGLAFAHSDTSQLPSSIRPGAKNKQRKILESSITVTQSAVHFTISHYKRFAETICPSWLSPRVI